MKKTNSRAAVEKAGFPMDAGLFSMVDVARYRYYRYTPAVTDMVVR